VPGVSKASVVDGEGEADVSVVYGSRRRPITIQCKNVLRKQTSAGLARMDF